MIVRDTTIPVTIARQILIKFCLKVCGPWRMSIQRSSACDATISALRVTSALCRRLWLTEDLRHWEHHDLTHKIKCKMKIKSDAVVRYSGRVSYRVSEEEADSENDSQHLSDCTTGEILSDKTLSLLPIRHIPATYPILSK